MSALEQSFADLAAKHDLLSVSVTFIRRAGDGWYTVNVQWADEACETGRDIAAGSDDSLPVALGNAARLMLAKRAPSVELADEPLQIGEAA